MKSDSSYSFKSLYCAFDRYPLPKGASTHIRYMASTLFAFQSPGMLYLQGDPQMPSWQQETLSLGSKPYEVSSEVSIVRHQLNPSSGNNVLAKALDYANQLEALLRQNRDTLTLAQFRDPWAGVPLLDHRKDNPALKLVYEVNALPSIELPIHLSLPRKTLAKISAWEQRCLDGADLIVTPSKLTAAGLEKRTSTPVVYLPNGAELPPTEPLRQAQDASLPRLIYFGAAQRWQGLRDLLKAFALVRQQLEVELDLCLSLENRQARQVKAWLKSMELEDCVSLHFGLDQASLRQKIQAASASLAPLTPCRRNMLQGCCPLKVLESMACGTAVIASDLPVIRELVTHEEHGLLVPPSKPSELARACIELLSQPAKAKDLGLKGQQRVTEQFQWQQICAQLSDLYHQLSQSPMQATA